MLERLLSAFVKNSNRNSYCINGCYYTYSTLLERIKTIYSIIEERNVKIGTSIGVTTIDDLDTYATIFAIWFYGCSYVPINPKLPNSRNRDIILQSSISLLISANGGKEWEHNVVPGLSVVDTSSASNKIINLKVFNRLDDSLLYVLFTSGSTGQPKGVPITYGNLKTFLTGFFDIGLELDENDRFLQMFDLTFDVSVASFLVPGLNGSCVYTIPSIGIKYLNVLKTIRDYKITVASIVPSILNYIQPYFKELSLPELRICILTAEASNYLVIDEWQVCLPNGIIYNFYGPTEATIWCTFYKSISLQNVSNSYNNMLAIGRSFSTVEARIFDEKGMIVRDGEKGELCISSDQLTPGYLNNLEKNKSSFFNFYGKRFYRTGDLCKIGNDGNIIYCGRIDHQIKVQGYRIELSEIDVVAKLAFRTNAVAVSYLDSRNTTCICLYVEGSRSEYEANEPNFKIGLPYYMVPNKIQYIDSLPYNSSGKVDRIKLSETAKVFYE